MIPTIESREAHESVTSEIPRLEQLPPVKQFCSWCKRWYIRKGEVTMRVEPPAINTAISHGGPCQPCRLKLFPQYPKH